MILFETVCTQYSRANALQILSFLQFDALSGDEFSVDENDPDFSPKKLKTVSVEAHVTRRRRGRPPKAKMLKQPKLEPQDSPQKELYVQVLIPRISLSMNK